MKIENYLFLITRYLLLTKNQNITELYNDDDLEEILNDNNYNDTFYKEEWKQQGFTMTHPENRIFLFKGILNNFDDVFNVIHNHGNLFANQTISISVLNDRFHFNKIINNTSKELLQNYPMIKDVLSPLYSSPLNATEKTEFPSVDKKLNTAIESKSSEIFNSYFFILCMTLFSLLMVILIVFIFVKIYKKTRNTRDNDDISEIIETEMEIIDLNHGS